MEEHSKVSVSKPNLEADDCIGILATNGNIASPVVWSEDKDLQQIPGLRWTPSGVVEVSEHDADLFFYTQVLTGDTADGYPGCTGIGPVKADALLSGVDITDVESVWSIIKGTYAKANIPEDFALTQAQLARILRSSDWDKTKQEPILWTPHRTRTV
jgi:DNA polymerase-1